jgi:hypothetical protein
MTVISHEDDDRPARRALSPGEGGSCLRGQKFRELVAEGLARVLDAPAEQRPKPKMSTLMKRARGVMDSGVSDLASNPKHLSGFGRNARHR